MGVQHAMAQMIKASEAKRNAYVQGNILRAEQVMTESQRRVPVSQIPGKPGGRLKNSKFTEHRVNSTGVVSILGYRAEYAIFVHEIPPSRAFHPVGSWQYLRGPLEEAAPSWAKEVAKFVESQTE